MQQAAGPAVRLVCTTAILAAHAGVSFREDYALPGATVVINDTSLAVTASSFDNVGAKQSALLVLQNATLVMSDTVFSNNIGTNAGARLPAPCL